MKKNKDLLPFENIMTAYFTGKNPQQQATLAAIEAEIVFKQPITAELPAGKVNSMINSLVDRLSKDTLGSVITSSLNVRVLEEKELQEKTGLTPSLVEAIKNDLIFTNSVPVKSLVKLLKLLEITADKALAAIEITYDKLQTESRVFLSAPMNIQPSFRKGMVRSELGKDLSHLKADESYLYQNKEALDKYTGRLVELYQIL